MAYHVLISSVNKYFYFLKHIDEIQHVIHFACHACIVR